MTRIFKKPTKVKGESNLSDGSVQTPLPSRFLKRPEDIRENPKNKYLQELELKIFNAEKDWESKKKSIEQESSVLDEQFTKRKAYTVNEIISLESVLTFKRQERLQLEAPFVDRTESLNERENALNKKSSDLEDEKQAIFERERGYEIKLESVKDLADEVAETRTKLSIRLKLLDGKESALKTKEAQHLVHISEFEEAKNNTILFFQEREQSIILRELNLESKEENLAKREKQLLEGHILLNDQRGTLSRAWKELERKKHGSST